MKKLTPILTSWIMVVALAGSALADYTIVLKNGRRITVQSYREEGNMLRIQGLGGEFAIPKTEVRTITKASETNQGLSLRRLELESSPHAPTDPSVPLSGGESASEPENGVTENTEEKEYQARLSAIVRQLEAAQQRYISASQGGSAGAAATKEGYKAMVADVLSRLKDRQGPQDSEFEAQAIELRKLRAEIDRLQKERDVLVDEMKRKNFATSR